MLEFEAPGDWRLVPLRQFAEERKVRAGDREVLVLSVTKHDGLVASGEYFSRTVHSRDTSSYKLLATGDFAYATIHLDEGSVDYLRSEVSEEGAVSPMYTVFRLDPRVADHEFLRLVLRSGQARRVWQRIGKGSITRRKSVPFKTLGRIPIPLPPLREQRKIAAILSSVDDAIATTRRVIEQTKRAKQGLLQTLMTRGIGHTRFKKTQIGKIPEAWEVVSLLDVSIGKGTYGASARKADYSPELPRYLRITDINDDGTLSDSDLASLSEDEANGNFVEVGDVLFARSGATVGKTYLVSGKEGRAAYAGYLIRFKPDPSKLEPGFLNAFTHSAGYWSWVADSQRAMAQPNINAAEYGSMLLPRPPLSEQQEIVRVHSSFRELQDRHERTAARLKCLKRGLMQDLLTGRVRVQPD